MQKLHVELGKRGYDITVLSGALALAGEVFDLNRKVFILTDSGVPREYSEKIKSAASDAIIYTVPMGEGAKSFAVLENVLTSMLEFNMGRGDALVAVGGGVVGDLGGFAASVYMRGIDFYSVPTTLLSQVDSSIGGKTAINLGAVKNTVGAFHQPRGVLVDTDTLDTLPKRQIAGGLAEVIKMAATFDEELFERLEADGFNENNREEIITAALKIKKGVVEEDECERGLRKVLNFGHTLGHGIESSVGLGTLLHGECVALGMVPVAFGEAKERIIALSKNLGLPMDYKYDFGEALAPVVHDKKQQGGMLSVILVDKIGSYRMEKMSIAEFCALVNGENI